MITDNTTSVTPTDADKAREEKVQQEMARMISDLNEVRMRLDTIIRRIAENSRSEGHEVEAVDRVEELRVTLASQLDRMREKIIERLPEPT